MPPFEAGEALTGSNFIVENSTDTFPLAIAINKLRPGIQSLYEREGLCSADQVAFAVVRKSVESKVCTIGLTLDVQQPMYLYEFDENGLKYLVTITQYFNYEKAMRDSEYSQMVEAKIDLRPQHEKLKKLLSSIAVQDQSLPKKNVSNLTKADLRASATVYKIYSGIMRA